MRHLTPDDSTAQDWYPLTAGQMDFWEEALHHPGQPVSTVAHCIALAGPLDEDAFARAITRTIAEAETLALAFRVGADGQVMQCVDPARRPTLVRHDLRTSPDPEGEARRLMRADVDAPLDLARDPLSAQMLLRTGDTRWLWYSRGHHIILDGYGMSLIEGRVAQLYAAAAHGSAPGTPFAPLAAFLIEEAAHIASKRCAAERAYWAEHLGAARAVLPVLTKGAEDYGLPPLRTDFTPGPTFEADLRTAAGHLALNWGDMLTLLSAVWLRGHDPAAEGRTAPMPVWLPYMSRMGSVSARIPAMVVNILPLIVDLPPGEVLGDSLRRLAATLRRHRRHGRYRIEGMARDCGIAAGQRFYFSPLINVMPFAPPQFAGVQAERQVLAAGPGDGFNISFTADTTGTGISAVIEAEASAVASRAEFHSRAAAFQAWLAQSTAQLAAG